MNIIWSVGWFVMVECKFWKGIIYKDGFYVCVFKDVIYQKKI